MMNAGKYMLYSGVVRNPAYICIICRRISATSEKTPVPVKHDIIGPPNNVSNLRPILFHVPKNESSIEKQFRLKREEVQKWNEVFWTNHNTKFFKQKEKFMSDHARGKSANDAPMSSDEISVFYKKFLDENWKIHQSYNAEWYRKNVGLLVLALRVFMYRIVMKLKIVTKIL